LKGPLDFQLISTITKTQIHKSNSNIYEDLRIPTEYNFFPRSQNALIPVDFPPIPNHKRDPQIPFRPNICKAMTQLLMVYMHYSIQVPRGWKNWAI